MNRLWPHQGAKRINTNVRYTIASSNIATKVGASIITTIQMQAYRLGLNSNILNIWQLKDVTMFIIASVVLSLAVGGKKKA